MKTEVNKKRPCPACRGTRWCVWFENSECPVLFCMRSGGSEVQGMRLISEKGGGWCYVWDEDVGRMSDRPSISPPSQKATVNGKDWQRRFSKLMQSKSESVRILAKQLGLKGQTIFENLQMIGMANSEHMDSLGVGGSWSSRPSVTWTFAEYRPEGISGWTFRDRNGAKGSASTSAGCMRGLTFNALYKDADRTVWIVEGASDVLACHEAGIPAVGRPHNSGGGLLLRQMLAPAKDYIVLGENDRKYDSGMRDWRWPGREGAETIAMHLEEEFGRPVPVCLPPQEYKDIRSWMIDRKTKP